MSNPAASPGGEAGLHLIGQVHNVIKPGWQVTEDGRGLLEGDLSIQYTSSPDFPKPPGFPNRGQGHPFDSRLKCYKSSSTMSSAGSVVVQASYIGLTQDPTYAETETSGTTSGNPIPLHPNFQVIAMAVKPDALGENFQYYPFVRTQNEDGLNFERFDAVKAPEGLRGVESYYAPRATIRVSFYTASASTAQKMLTNIGTIDDKPYLANGPMPTGGNFLLTSASVTTYGTIYKISSEWMMSEQGHKWTPYLYRAFGSGGKKVPQYSIGGDYRINATWTF